MALKLMAIDGSNIGFAAMYQPALATLTHAGQPTGGMLGLAQSVIRLSKLFPEHTPVVLWDGHAEWRKALCPEYKATRKNTPEKLAIADSWHRQAPYGQVLLQHLGVIQARSPVAEADDLAGWMCQRLFQEDQTEVSEILLISGDKDWWQALSPRVAWFSPITDVLVTLEDLTTGREKDGGPFTGVDEYLLAKAMAGDDSDNIPGIPGVGLKTAVKLLRQHGGLDGIRQAVAAGQAKDKKSADIAENTQTILRNLHIMDWAQAPTLQPGQMGVLAEAFDREATLDWCVHFGLKQLSGRFEKQPSTWEAQMAGWDKAAAVEFLEQI